MNMRASRQSLAPLRARWNALAPREQNMTLLAGGVVALALLWWVALAPALHSLRTAP
jgi:general secretion pathway protein M